MIHWLTECAGSPHDRQTHWLTDCYLFSTESLNTRVVSISETDWIRVTSMKVQILLEVLSASWLTDCMCVGWLTVVTESVAWISRCAACWLQPDRQTDRLTDWLWLTVTDCDWLNEWLVECVQTTAWHVDFHLRCDGVEKRRLSSSVLAWSWHCIRLLWVSKWVNYWLSDWVTEWLTKWVNDWLVD